ncbi:peroxisomal 2,4-dienoyl-CoA reductase [(3E)-enoyl-CoA-producing] isoform 2-T2 [Anomaloglossus baeobatrachus]
MSSTLPPPDQPPEDVESDDCLPAYTYLYSPTLLQGRVAFITGGGSGIGFRIAEIFMRHGCDTIIVSRNIQRVTEAAEKLRGATGRHCLPLTADVRQPQTLTDAVEEALRTFSRIDILVNNAAGNFLCPASSLSCNAFKNVLDIDTMGTFNASKILYERYFRDHGGVILNITATLSYKGSVLQVHAGSAKAAIGLYLYSASRFGFSRRGRHVTPIILVLLRTDAMTKHLAVEWGPCKVRVNGIAPGPIGGTEGMRRLGGAAAESIGMWDTIPLQRLGNKTEVAHGALFLVSPLASYVTGTTLVMDGGSWMTLPNHMASVLGTPPSPHL